MGDTPCPEGGRGDAACPEGAGLPYRLIRSGSGSDHFENAERRLARAWAFFPHYP